MTYIIFRMLSYPLITNKGIKRTDLTNCTIGDKAVNVYFFFNVRLLHMFSISNGIIFEILKNAALITRISSIIS